MSEPVARIHKPAKTAMQSGKALTHAWVLEYEPVGARFIDPLMGWTGTHDTRGQMRLKFETREAAVAYAEERGIPFEVEEPKTHHIRRRAYADNFSFHRIR